jgi:hypothetical protein
MIILVHGPTGLVDAVAQHFDLTMPVVSVDYAADFVCKLVKRNYFCARSTYVFFVLGALWRSYVVSGSNAIRLAKP